MNSDEMARRLADRFAQLQNQGPTYRDVVTRCESGLVSLEIWILSLFDPEYKFYVHEVVSQPTPE